MIAIAKMERDPVTGTEDAVIAELKFSVNIADASAHAVNIIDVREPVVTDTESNKEGMRANVRRPMNNPFGLSVINRSIVSDLVTTRLPITESSDTARDNPYCRQLSASEKESISVRPAAERAGQTSFFGNL